MRRGFVCSGSLWVSDCSQQECEVFLRRSQKKKMTQQFVIVRGWSWAPGWVTVVSLCCFCNVALIFATMKTFILQQVKCCHLSPFLTQTNSVQSISSLDPSHRFIFPFLVPRVSPLLPSSLAFHFGPPSLMCSIVLWQSASGDLLFLGVRWAEGFNISHLSRSQPSHLCYGFTVTNEKSICPVDTDVVLGQRILTS